MNWMPDGKLNCPHVGTIMVRQRPRFAMSSAPYGVLPIYGDHNSLAHPSNPFLARLPASLRRWRLRSSSKHSGAMIRPRALFNILKFAIPIALLAFWWAWRTFEPHLHVDLVFYDRNWIANEIHPITPLSGCFNPDRVSPLYNVTEELYGKKRFEVQAGVPMRMGMDCYAFAGTVVLPERDTQHDAPMPPENRHQYHTYWRTDLAPLGERQEFMLRSFFATQNRPRSRLVLWSNGDLSENPIVQKYLQRYPESFSLGVADIPTLAKGTAMEASKLLQLNDKKAWVDGDLVRLLVIWHYGGMWIDMDMLLTRDLEPLLEHEFVTQWDCWGNVVAPLYVHQLTIPHSPFFLIRHRQNLPSAQWCAHALQTIFTLSLRSLPPHGALYPSSIPINRLGCDPLPPPLASPSCRISPSFQDPPLLLLRSARVSAGQQRPRPVYP